MFETSKVKRDVSVTLMLTPAEKAYLDRMAEESGIRQSDILRLGLQAMSELHERGDLNG